MSVESAAKKQGLTILGREGDDYLCALESIHGYYIVVFFYDEDDDMLRLTRFGSGQTYTLEQIARIPVVAGLLAACEGMIGELTSGRYAGLQMLDGFWVAYDKMQVAITAIKGEPQ